MKETFLNKNYVWLFAFSFIVMFSLFILIPIKIVAGNSFTIQLSILSIKDYVIIILLSGVYSLFVPMQVFVMKKRKKSKEIGTVVGGSVGVLVAGIAGTAFCTACLAPLFALFGIGFGGVLFVLEYHLYFVIAIVVLMLLAIYFTARKIQSIC